MSSTSSNFLKQHDRFRWMILKLVGHYVRVRCVDHRVFEGLLHNAVPSASGVSVELRHAREAGASVLSKHIDDVQLKSGEIEGIDAINIGWMMDKTVRHSRKNFNTDTGISKAPGFEGHRELVAWTDDGSNADLGLDELEGDAANQWDQFETAKKLWGFESTYDENLYTTRLDKASDLYKTKAAEAERIAAEIMSQQTANPHVAEERGQETEELKQMDDADRYSDVIRDDPHAASTSSQPPASDADSTPAPSDASSAEADAADKNNKLRADAAEFNPFEQMSFLSSAVKNAPASFIPTSPTSSPMMPYHMSPVSPSYPHPQMSSMYYQPPYYGSPPSFMSYPTSPSSYGR